MEKNSSHNFVNHTLKSLFYYGVSGSFVKLLVPINVLLVIASLSPYQYGVYKLTFSVFVIINGLLLAGINGLVLNDASRHFGNGREEQGKRLLFEFFVLRIVLGIVACAVFYLSSGFISEHYSPGIALYLRLLAVLFITDAITTIVDVVLKTKLDFLGSSLVSVLPEVVKFVFVIYFAYFAVDGLNILRLFWAILFANVIASILLALYAIAKFGILRSIPKADSMLLAGMIRTYGKWAVAKNYISLCTDNARLWIIKLFISTEAVAVYSVAMSIVTTIRKVIPTQFIASLVPRYVEDSDEIRKIYTRTTKYSIWIFAFVTVASLIAVPPLIGLLMPQYVASTPYFLMLLPVIMLNSMILNKQVIYSLHKQRFIFLSSFIELTSLVAFGVILVKMFGISGVVYETLITELVMFLVMYLYLVRRRPDLAFPWWSVFTFNQEDVYWVKYMWNKLSDKFQNTI